MIFNFFFVSHSIVLYYIAHVPKFTDYTSHI